MYIFKNIISLFSKKQNLGFATKFSTYKEKAILKEECKDLVLYANQRKIKLSHFKKFSGDINVIKSIIDDIVVISIDFPKILEGRKSIELCLDFYLNDDVFATTINHVIYVNAYLFSDVELLQSEYDSAVLDGKFVKNTDFHAIIRHETGHVVANIYKLNPMRIAKIILNSNHEPEIIEYISNELSLYATECPDGREFISESFSGYYSNAGNQFADTFVKKCIEEVDSNEKKL